MPRYQMTYSYDIPCCAEFVVEAATAEAALAIAHHALEAGRFNSVIGEAEPFNPVGDSEGVACAYDGEPLPDGAGVGLPTLDQLTAKTCVEG